MKRLDRYIEASTLKSLVLVASGLTALFSRILADAGISCNVIAGLAHDHLFVGWDQGARALTLLRDP